VISFCSRKSDEKLRYAAANWLSADSTSMTGTSASGGRSPRTRSTLAPISASARLASWLSSRRARMIETFWRLSDSM